MIDRNILIVGAGEFGLAAALELAERGESVMVIDPGPVPHPDASSTDISKAVRMDYGADRFYAEMAAEALDGWRRWNRDWPEPLFHETGILLLSRRSLDEGGFEAASWALMRELDLPVERLDTRRLVERFPAWAGTCFVDGYFNPCGGWAESGRVVARLADLAGRAGVEVREGCRVARLSGRGDRVDGVVLEDGTHLSARTVLVAAGAWTPRLLPELATGMWPVGQPVAHYRPADPSGFDGARFPVWCGDIARTGWYGFPLAAGGQLKVAHHGPGRRIGGDEPLRIDDGERARFEQSIDEMLPALQRAPIDGTRLCLYCDTWDGDFLIDRHPDRPGLAVAAGGSGHAFKFAPLIGRVIADALEGSHEGWGRRFAWRTPGERRAEDARAPST